MKNTDIFDVLVVYSAGYALSANLPEATHPFSVTTQTSYNNAYAYLLEYGKKRGLRVALTPSADITGPGTTQSYWTYERGNWKKHLQSASARHIFDKTSPISPVRVAERKLLFSDAAIRPFNDIELFEMFTDKLTTYKKFAQEAIPTVGIKSSRLIDINDSLEKLQKLLQKHPHRSDFTTQIIVKDRSGAGGINIHKVSEDFAHSIQKILKQNKENKFILQPFVAFDKGYTHEKKKTAADIRFIFLKNKIVQCYVRMPQNDDFRCNSHQGGSIAYVSLASISKDLRLKAEALAGRINKPSTMYALDFVVSNDGNPYFIEGNIGPGITWNETDSKDKRMSKQLIRCIVDEFALRVEREKLKIPATFRESFFHFFR